MTLYALQFSELLEVNEEGTKVRRRSPIPEYLMNIPPSKILLAWDILPQEHTISTSLLFQTLFLDKITKLFSPFGDITSIRILRPGKKLPSDVKKYSARYPELLSKCCALVEYEGFEGARKAFEELGHNQASSSGEILRVVSLSGRGSKKKSMAMANQEDAEELDDLEKPPRLWTNLLPEGRQHALEDSLFYSSSTESDSTPVSTPFIPRNFLSAPVWPTTSFCNSTSLAFKPNFFSIPYAGAVPLHKSLGRSFSPSPLAAAPKLGTVASESQRPSCSCWDSGMASGVSLTPRQRGSLCSHPLQMKPELLGASPMTKRISESLGPRLQVIRLPHGPDGTKGFYNTIGRGKFVLRH